MDQLPFKEYRMPYITPIPALKDNYIWLIINPISHHCLIVDPGESQPVIEALMLHHWRPVAILLTHHHADHTAGAKDLSQRYQIPVFGAALDAIPAVTHPLRGGESLPFKELSLSF